MSQRRTCEASALTQSLISCASEATPAASSSFSSSSSSHMSAESVGGDPSSQSFVINPRLARESLCPRRSPDGSPGWSRCSGISCGVDRGRGFRAPFDVERWQAGFVGAAVFSDHRRIDLHQMSSFRRDDGDAFLA